MGLLKGIFGSNKNQEASATRKIGWEPLTTLMEIETLDRKSQARPQVIFKHSTTCGISRMVLNMFEANCSITEEQMDFYFLDIRKYRDVSNEISDKFGVIHQSPQLLVVHNGVVVAHDSHGAISRFDLSQYA